MSAWEGSVWQEAQERMREQIAKRGRSGCGHPGCDIDDHPFPAQDCVLSKPLMLSVPAGTHMHIDCPVHGKGAHVIRGSGATL